MVKANGQSRELDEVMENMRPGDRHELCDANGKIVAVLGAPSDEEFDEPISTSPAGQQKSPHSAWLE